MNLNIACVSGDGIGPEVIAEAKRVLNKITEEYNHNIVYKDVLMGGASIDAYGEPLTDEVIGIAKAADAVLLGSIGGNTATSPWYKLAPELRPEAGLLRLRKALNLFANFRPAYLYEELPEACPIRKDVIGNGFDMVIVRELTGGLYFGERHTKEVNGVITAVDTLSYSEKEIHRVAVKAFEIAMKLVKKPNQFDVILTENMFGDILSDEASAITGSIGMLPSASLNETRFGLYEPSGGAAPDIAGKGIVNPIATILSAAMMLRYSFDLEEEAGKIESAVKQVLKEGYRTVDIMPQDKNQCKTVKQVGTETMGKLIAEYI
ncbi:MAG: 3-isopropylmalate dehydrogenase [Lachnospiraceae bacterium]|nr:3-isopropylmalate dehydrogenase [Lachnospiraceae bacterium]